MTLGQFAGWKIVLTFSTLFPIRKQSEIHKSHSVLYQKKKIIVDMLCIFSLEFSPNLTPFYRL
jgi:hypothetical protein